MFQKNQKLKGVTIRQMFLLITYTILLIWGILNYSQVLGVVRMVLDLLKPFVYGFMIAFIFNIPMTFFLQRLPISIKKGRKAIAATLAMLVILVIISFIFRIVVPTLVDSVASLAAAFPKYAQDVQVYVEKMIATHQISETYLQQLDKYTGQIQDYILNILKTGVPQLLTAASGIASSLANLFMAIVIAVYLLVSKEKLLNQAKRFLYAFFSERVYYFCGKVGHLTNTTFTSFVTGQLLEAIIIGILCYIGCLIFRFPYAPILSVIIGCTNVIPIFGAILGVGLSALLVAFVDPLQGVFFVIFGIFLQQFESNLIYPRVVGTTVGLSGLWVLFAITIGGGLFQLPGMLLGLPVFSIIYTLLKEEMNRRIQIKQSKKILIEQEGETC